MSIDSKHIIDHLSQKGISVTANRILVFAELANADRALSLSDLEALMPTMDKSSIFRTLNLFVQKDIAHTFQDGRGHDRYELCFHSGSDHYAHEHPHFYCERCERTFCLDDHAIAHAYPHSLSHFLPDGFRPRSASLLIRGLCPDCAKH